MASSATTRSMTRGVLTAATITRRRERRFRDETVVGRPTCYLSAVRTKLAIVALAVALGLGGACGGDDRAHPYAFPDSGVTTGGGGGIDTGLMDGPPSPDAPGLCGNLVIPALEDPPNLYFIVDRSGSMSDNWPGSSYNKYQNARIAIGKVLRAIGHRVRYGAAVFPQPGGVIDGCGAGAEAFATQPGDPPGYAATGKDGPVLQALLGALNLLPSGGTPIAPTIAALSPTLTALEGKTFVVLFTDGAPNCNPSLLCPAESCSLNIEGFVVNDIPCVAPNNCCDQKVYLDGPLYCVDEAATQTEVANLAAAGIPTYVVGMPGSEAYSNLLDQLAVAGGTARPTAPLYYSVNDAENLADTLKQIGVKVAIKCSVDLESAPPDPNLVNVYFDENLVQLDPTDGWSWTSETSLEINGAACDKLKSGDVLQLQVVSGCPTSVK